MASPKINPNDGTGWFNTKAEQLVASIMEECKHGAPQCSDCRNRPNATCSHWCEACAEEAARPVEQMATNPTVTRVVTTDCRAQCRRCGEKGLKWAKSASSRWYLEVYYETRWVDVNGEHSAVQWKPHFLECPASPGASS